MKQANLKIGIMLIMVFILSACSFGSIETTQTPQSLPTSMIAEVVVQPAQQIVAATTYTVDCPGLKFELTIEVIPINWYCNNSSAVFRFSLPNGTMQEVLLTNNNNSVQAQVGQFVAACSGNLDLTTCSHDVQGYNFAFNVKVSAYSVVQQPVSTAAPQSNLIVAESPTPTSNVIYIMPEGTAPPGKYIKCGWGDDANIVTCIYVAPDYISYHYADKKMAVYGPKLTEEGDLIAVGPVEITCYIEEGERYSLMLTEDSTGTRHYVSNDSQSCSGFLEP